MAVRLYSLMALLALVVSLGDSVHAQSSSAPLIVEADTSLQWRRDEGQYIATGNAVARQGEITLRASVITADYIDKETAEGEQITITRIIGHGDARLEANGYRSQAGMITP